MDANAAASIAPTLIRHWTGQTDGRTDNRPLLFAIRGDSRYGHGQRNSRPTGRRIGASPWRVVFKTGGRERGSDGAGAVELGDSSDIVQVAGDVEQMDVELAGHVGQLLFAPAETRLHDCNNHSFIFASISIRRLTKKRNFAIELK